ncbi:MAG: ribose 5-phosphate isomerase B [Clostridia bacterium]|jgi:ribose 5-phosphate isomerase B|nr:ribose 5-phosphate isomerase B [Clostridia bacterium]MBR3485985.1 ribose 5-phosphate isomerase B [Clostridia bacterium]
MNIAVCSDHGGFELKLRLIPFIEEMGHTVTDFGCCSEASVDYPDMAFPMAEAVAAGEYERGIAICGTGIGVSICCNKVKGIRCALCGDVLSAELTRRHNDSNVLAMGGRIIGPETAKAITRVWLETGFDGGRHENRINKITEYEK